MGVKLRAPGKLKSGLQGEQWPWLAWPFALPSFCSRESDVTHRGRACVALKGNNWNDEWILKLRAEVKFLGTKCLRQIRHFKVQVLGFGY